MKLQIKNNFGIKSSFPKRWIKQHPPDPPPVSEVFLSRSEMPEDGHRWEKMVIRSLALWSLKENLVWKLPVAFEPCHQVGFHVWYLNFGLVIDCYWRWTPQSYCVVCATCQRLKAAIHQATYFTHIYIYAKSVPKPQAIGLKKHIV